MIRFRNPGSDVETQIAIFRSIYQELSSLPSFTVDDMEQVIGKTNLMTSYGHSGQQALAITSKRVDSLNSTKMNMKMYAEIFRMIGWISPQTTSTSYPCVFTFIGRCAGTSNEGARHLLEEGLLGFVNPTDHNPKVKFAEHNRPFMAALKTMNALGGRLHKKELCLGPMSYDDRSDETFDQMVDRLRSHRGSIENLNQAFSQLAISLSMKEVSVDNTTRFPIGAMRSVGWITTQVEDQGIFGKKQKLLEITDKGRDVLELFRDSLDLRRDDFERLPLEIQNPLIRQAVFDALDRSGYVLDDVSELRERDRALLASLTGGAPILFSPYQTLAVQRVDEALRLDSDFYLDHRLHPNHPSHVEGTVVENRKLSSMVTLVSLDAKHDEANPIAERNSASQIRSEILNMAMQGMTSSEIVEALFTAHSQDKQTAFYPFIADLFTLIGMPCTESRAGDNGARWDAMIADDRYSIPIEIKSPTEEMNLSLKAIRQALENKVVLLSRRTHNTSPDVTSLAVGYEPPNARAEVGELIADCYEAFGIRIGVITLRTLLMLVVPCVLEDKSAEVAKVRTLRGLLDASL